MREKKIISFDCMGTLIDWKRGVLNNLRPLFNDYLIEIDDEEIFKWFLEFYTEMISGEFITYRSVLQNILKRFAVLLNTNFSNDDLYILIRSLPNWPVFPDTIDSLRKLGENYKLAIISNLDHDLIEECFFMHEVKFDWVLTSEDLKSFKPSQNTFIQALNRFSVPQSGLTHVAQNFHHDIIPTNKLGINNVWINRYAENIDADLQTKAGLVFPDLAQYTNFLSLNFS